MKKYALMLMLLVIILSAAVSCASAEIDPILLDEPNEKVFSCKNDIFFELLDPPSISKVASGRNASDYFMVLRAEILFLVDGHWEGIDRNSFLLKWTDPDGKETLFPLNYAISMMSNQKVAWYTFSEPYDFTDLRKTNLVFDVTPYTFDGWTLVFRPTERGSDTAYCEINIPLIFK